MDVKIGVDNVAISRFGANLLFHSTFLNRCFTSKEQEYCLSKTDPSPHFAARFAAKEAVIKALSGFDLILEHNKIEITNDARGRPSVHYLTDEPSYSHLHTDVSLSHSETSAIAVVVVYR
jgi:holo-[acyl-carrier protein] synthase